MSVSEKTIEMLTKELAELEGAIQEERRQSAIDSHDALMEKLTSLGIDVSAESDEYTTEETELIQKEIETRAKSHTGEKSVLEEEFGKVQEAIFEKTSLSDLKIEQERLEKNLAKLPELRELMENKNTKDIELRMAMEQKVSSIEHYLLLKDIKKQTRSVKTPKVGKPYIIAVFVTIAVLATLTLLIKLFPN